MAAKKKATRKKTVTRKKTAARKKNPSEQPRFIIWTYARQGNMELKKRYIHKFGVHEAVTPDKNHAEIFSEKKANEVLLEMYRRHPRSHHGFHLVKK